jgi:hypothetical protein
MEAADKEAADFFGYTIYKSCFLPDNFLARKLLTQGL